MHKQSDLPLADFNAMSEELIEAANTTSWIVVLPLGATEQHGPHLPLETDTIIAGGVVDLLKERIPGDLKVTFLPVEPVGYSPEHMDYVGGRTLPYDEAINRWIGIGERLHRLGIRKLVLLNAHGGNSPLMTIVATELRCRFEMLCVATSWTRFGRPVGLIDDEAAAVDIHGGDIETSVMLALRPELVDMDKAEDFPSSQSRWLDENRYLHAYGRHAFGWKIQDLNPAGAVGNASAATGIKGLQLLDHSIAGLVELMEEVDRFDIENLKTV